MKKIIISIAFLLNTAAQTMEATEQPATIEKLQADARELANHIKENPTAVFSVSENLFHGLNASGFNKEGSFTGRSTIINVNPSEDINETTFTKRWRIFRLEITTHTKLDPEKILAAFKQDTEVANFNTRCSKDKKTFYGELADAWSTKTVTYQYTHPKMDVAKVVVGATVIGLGVAGLYHYLNRQ